MLINLNVLANPYNGHDALVMFLNILKLKYKEKYIISFMMLATV